MQVAMEGSSKDANDVRHKEIDDPVRNTPTSSGSKPVKRVTAPRAKRAKKNQIPEEVLHNASLNEAIKSLPSNYNFEIHKTVWKILNDESISRVALQFPEGLLMYACVISDILEKFAFAQVVILGDVTYGACCVDDFTAAKVGAHLLVHYGHSCLVPLSVTSLKLLYVFVEIAFDVSHFVQCLRDNFDPHTKIAVMGTIQFSSAIHEAMGRLQAFFPHMSSGVPQAKPLSAGETLGCTAPVIQNAHCLVFVADGRFHLEAAMIQNPTLRAYRYDPYGKVISAEGYDTVMMKANRLAAIQEASRAQLFGVVLGTLGRQGSPLIFDRLRALLRLHGRRCVLFLMAELSPAKLAAIEHIEAWVQVSCPRLSIDWGAGFAKPVLTPYELEVMLKTADWQDVYPMDYYSDGGGSWTNYGVRHAAAVLPPLPPPHQLLVAPPSENYDSTVVCSTTGLSARCGGSGVAPVGSCCSNASKE